MSARKFRHVGYAGEVEQARSCGGTNRVLCGRRVRPLPPEELDALPTCPTCAHARDSASVIDTATTYHFTGSVWGGAA